MPKVMQSWNMVAPVPRFLAGRHSDMKTGTTTAIMPALRPCKVRPKNSGKNPGAVTINTTLKTNSSAEMAMAFFRPKRSAKPPPIIDEANCPDHNRRGQQPDLIFGHGDALIEIEQCSADDADVVTVKQPAKRGDGR